MVKILYPIRMAIMNLEAQTTNLADCFLQFVQLAAAIKKVSNIRAKGFKSYCVKIFNKRWRDFNADNYLLAYFLHPGYRGAGLREQQFESIVTNAIKIWQQEGHDKYECANLAAHMRLFYEKKKGFHLPYCFETDTPLLWWSTNYTGAKSVGKLAIKLFSITPHSADCERTFSSLGWLYGKRRQQLSLSRIQAMAQVRSFYMSNIEKELVFFGKKLSYNDLQEQVKSATFLVEDDEGIIEDEDITDDPEEDAIEYDSEIIERFDIENIVFLRDEMFQDGESDADSEESQSDRSDEFNEDEMDVNNKIGQGEFDFDPTDLAADFMKEWSDEIVDNTIGEEDIGDYSIIVENDNENLESLPIALRKTCRKNLKDNS